jgi:hypothetical protein
MEKIDKDLQYLLPNNELTYLENMLALELDFETCSPPIKSLEEIFFVFHANRTFKNYF